jgi:hypothetical protein
MFRCEKLKISEQLYDLMKSTHSKNTLLQATTNQRCNQSLQESIFSTTQEKLKNKKNPSFQKNKTSFLHTMQTLTNIVSNVNRFGQRVFGLDMTTIRTDRRASGNSGFAKKRVQWLIEHPTSHQLLCYVDSFELRNPLLRKAAKRV